MTTCKIPFVCNEIINRIITHWLKNALIFSFQMDMENLLEFQVHERLKTEDKVEKTKTELEREKKQARSPFPWS